MSKPYAEAIRKAIHRWDHAEIVNGKPVEQLMVEKAAYSMALASGRCNMARSIAIANLAHASANI